MDKQITNTLVLALAVPFPVIHILLGLANLSTLTTTLACLAAMAVCIVTMCAAAWPVGSSATSGTTSPDQLGPIRSVTVVSGTALMSILVSVGLPQGIALGYATWHTGALQMFLVALTLRRRGGFAAAGIILFLIIEWTVAYLNQIPVQTTVALTATPVAWVLAGAILNKMLVKRNRTIARALQNQRSDQRLLAQKYAAESLRIQWVQTFAQRSRPALERIANASIAAPDLTESDRISFRLLEAELRDQIRGRALIAPGIAEAVWQARARGVRVTLIDDLHGALDPEIAEQVRRNMLIALNGRSSGFVTVRADYLGATPRVRIIGFTEDAPDLEFAWTITDTVTAPTAHTPKSPVHYLY